MEQPDDILAWWFNHYLYESQTPAIDCTNSDSLNESYFYSVCYQLPEIRQCRYGKSSSIGSRSPTVLNQNKRRTETIRSWTPSRISMWSNASGYHSNGVNNIPHSGERSTYWEIHERKTTRTSYVLQTPEKTIQHLCPSDDTKGKLRRMGKTLEPPSLFYGHALFCLNSRKQNTVLRSTTSIHNCAPYNYCYSGHRMPIIFLIRRNLCLLTRKA